MQNALDEFLAPLFKNNPQRKHLANDLTGLMISDNKTVGGSFHYVTGTDEADATGSGGVRNA